jgi:hypothetical protein
MRPACPSRSMRRSLMRLVVVATLTSGCSDHAAPPEPEPTRLTFRRWVQVTQDEDGGANRPQLTAAGGQLQLVYRGNGRPDRCVCDPDCGPTCFGLDDFVLAYRILNLDLEPVARGTLAAASGNRRASDNRTTGDGTSVYFVHEEAEIAGSPTTDPAHVFIDKLDGAGLSSVSTELAGQFSHPATPQMGVERGDDPGPFMCRDRLCVITETANCAASNPFRVRVFDPVTLALQSTSEVESPPLVLVPCYIAMPVDTGNGYLVASNTWSRLCEDRPPQFESEVILLHYSYDWKYRSSFDADGASQVELRPTGFKHSRGRYLIAYPAQASDARFVSAIGGEPVAVRIDLKLLEDDLTELQKVDVVRDVGVAGLLGGNPSIEVVDDKVFVAFHGAFTASDVPNLYLAEYGWE